MSRFLAKKYKTLDAYVPGEQPRDKKYITGTDMSLSSAARLFGEGTLAVGYAMPEELCLFASERGAEIYDLSLDEDFLYENARLSAKGALGVILTDFRREPADLKIGIIGYGRIGKEMLAQLLFLGAAPKVYTGRKEVCLSLCEAGVECELVSEKSDFSGLDLIVNTAPAKIISDESLALLPSDTRILDLASGKIFPDCDRVKKLASIPETAYPESGGKIMAKYVLKRLGRRFPEVVL